MADFNAGVTPADVAPGVEDTPGSGAVGVVLHNADENQSVYVRLGHAQTTPATNRPGDTGATWGAIFPQRQLFDAHLCVGAGRRLPLRC